ncbi:four helix bundle protein [Candidatus Woesebacteria bacterium]|nr:four helix bundle protein [Candidatus Woesebacteria bacterium]
MKKNIIQEKSFNFALTIIVLYKKLLLSNEHVLSRQLLRSGTSIGANIEEAIAAQSRRDFLAKMYIALKESRETKYWLRLIHESTELNILVVQYLLDIEEIIAILSRITKTTREKND